MAQHEPDFGDLIKSIWDAIEDLRRRSMTTPGSSALGALYTQVQDTLADIQNQVDQDAAAWMAANAYTSAQVDQKIASPGAISPTTVNASGNITLAGDLFTPHGRITPVVSGYVAAYINTDGRLGASASARRFKQDITPRTYTLEQIAQIQIVSYRLRAAVAELGDAARVEIGVIAEQLIDAGLSEFVVFDDDGQTQTVAYERLDLVAVAGVQLLIGEVNDLKTRLTAAGL